MKTKFFTMLAPGLLLALAFNAFGQVKRPDAIWARTIIDGAITLDGNLNEPEWSKAEAIRVQYPVNTEIIPGSGWFHENGLNPPTDVTDATVRFLVQGNWLYLGITVKDSSVGGGLFNRFDGFLMNLRDHASPNRPAPPFEYFYAWVAEPWADTTLAQEGAAPGFFGFAGGKRDSANSQIWNAATTVQGISNNDATPDEGYTSEIAINLDKRGYKVMRPEGDILEFNMSIYDADWQWPLNPARYSGYRTWLQGPWGNASVYNVLRIHVRPDVTVNTGSLPDIPVDFIVPNAAFHADPAIDGQLDEFAWKKAPTLDLRFGDDALRDSYPGVGPYRSGQFQPEIGGVRAAVLDPADATLRWFFKGDWLYISADVRDQGVWANDNADQWDGIQITINDRTARNNDMVLTPRTLTARVGAGGVLAVGDYLQTLLADTVNGAKAALALKPNTTVNNFTDVDEGYNLELAIDLTKLGYASGRGDGVLFIGATLYDGDEFPNATDNYGNRVWWMREREGNAGPALGYMDAGRLLPPTEPPTNTSGRTDAVWARSTAGAAITLDGRLDEAAWSSAEAIRVQYPISTNMIPGSGWFNEGGVIAEDKTDATIRFLTKDNWLYLGITVKDASVGGGLFNRFDGFLMNLRAHESANRPAPPFEYFYAWVAEPWADTTLAKEGALPGFFGFAGGKRDSVNSQIWNAATTVQGLSNNDAAPDQGYTSEIAINLTKRGYDVLRTQGDIMEFNMSIYDADWQWPLDVARYSSNRTWLQGPWGNASFFNVLRIHARPDVTINSGAAPSIAAEIIVPSAGANPAPAIDGKLDETIWSKAPGLDLRYGDDALRNSYPSNGPFRSGQFQPEIGGVRAAVLDPADATLKWFFKDNWLYLGVDVRDQGVWANANQDQWDGIQIFINDRSTLSGDNVLLTRTLTARVDAGGALFVDNYLKELVASNGAQAALALKPNTTVSNFSDIDEGYTIEIALDLTKFGYPAGRGDGVLYIGATLYDGDEFANATDNYGNRVWWMRERENNAGPAWAHMDPNTVITGVAEQAVEGGIPKVFTLYGNYPNPFNPSTSISFGMPEAGFVTLKVFDILGRNVVSKPLGVREAGKHVEVFEAKAFASGIYFYRLHMTTAGAKKNSSTLYGRMMVIK
jgi:hypothetical protein